MTFCISFGRWGGFYFSHGYTTRLCLGWVALTFYPFNIDDLHSRQVNTVETLVDTIDTLSRQLKEQTQ